MPVFVCLCVCLWLCIIVCVRARVFLCLCEGRLFWLGGMSLLSHLLRKLLSVFELPQGYAGAKPSDFGRNEGQAA